MNLNNISYSFIFVSCLLTVRHIYTYIHSSHRLGLLLTHEIVQTDCIIITVLHCYAQLCGLSRYFIVVCTCKIFVFNECSTENKMVVCISNSNTQYRNRLKSQDDYIDVFEKVQWQEKFGVKTSCIVFQQYADFKNAGKKS